jgi:hypothetical protein
MGQKAVLSAIVGSVIMLLAGCASSSSQQENKAYTPHINPAEFTTKVDNHYFPLNPGTTFVYQGNKQGSTRDEMAVTSHTKKVMGVECVVVNEGTYDWFARDKEGTVWYFGEDTNE